MALSQLCPVKGIPVIFLNVSINQWWQCKQGHSEWSDMNCFILDKLTESELFTVHGNRNQTSEEFKASKSSLTESYHIKSLQIRCLMPGHDLI